MRLFLLYNVVVVGASANAVVAIVIGFNMTKVNLPFVFGACLLSILPHYLLYLPLS